MQNVKPISELRNYSKLLKEVNPGEPVYLTKNGYLRYILLAIEDNEKPRRHIQRRQSRLEVNSVGEVANPSTSKTGDKVQPVDDTSSNYHDIKTVTKNITSRLPKVEITSW